jgi:hypothetical protein
MQPTANPRANVSDSRSGEIPWLSQRTALRFAAAGILPTVSSALNFFFYNLETPETAFCFPGMKLL